MYGLSDPLNPREVNAEVDIVFVHGLNGNRNTTWTTGDVFWPQDLLPADVPMARILTFGYDSSVAHFWSAASQNRIDGHASTLLADLAGLRDRTETNERPIILVAHSLGGIICADALILGDNSPEPHIRNASTHIRRIAFLGTPHQGSSKAKWADTGRAFLELFKSTNKENVKDLQDKSEKLSSLGRAFPNLLRRRTETGELNAKIEVVCFFEELPSKVIGMIVPEESACLPGYEALSIHADHSSMSKFANRTDPGYGRVSSVLARWSRELTTAPPPVTQPPLPDTEKPPPTVSLTTPEWASGNYLRTSKRHPFIKEVPSSRVRRTQ
ncbi:MAG: hypothetical protein M1840_007351 [Geoglossum simile]|nr:MAG: hypothetical protein M1840_007351 [Geoglossum simile]